MTALEPIQQYRPCRQSVPPRASLVPPRARPRVAARRAAQVSSKSLTAPQRRAQDRTNRFTAAELVAAQLLRQYAPIVRQIVCGFQRKLPSNVQRDDLIAAGMTGLWDAIRRQAGQYAESFEYYARVRIRGAILDELRAQDWLPRRARAALFTPGANSAAPLSVIRLEDISEWEKCRALSSAPASSSEAALQDKRVGEVLAKAVELLPERERHIVSMHYFKGVKFKSIGTQLGVSEPRISQLHSRAMKHLRVLIVREAA
jgi:RNA polymerase sigma factor FliA